MYSWQLFANGQHVVGKEGGDFDGFITGKRSAFKASDLVFTHFAFSQPGFDVIVAFSPECCVRLGHEDRVEIEVGFRQHRDSLWCGKWRWCGLSHQVAGRGLTPLSLGHLSKSL